MAESYLEETYMGKEEYFELLRRKVNKDRPVYKRIAKMALRENIVRCLEKSKIN